MVKYWLPIPANLLSMHLYILTGHNFHILTSTNDLPIVTNELYLLPMVWQRFANVKKRICFYQFVPTMIGKKKLF